MFSKKEIFSIPNILCYLRILLVPVFLYVYFKLEADNNNHYLSVLILIISSITDFLDGFIARKYDMITELGKLVDPMADKLTQLVVACTLVVSYPSYIWLIVIILLKDGMLLLAGIYLLKKSGKHLEQAEMPGKVATCVFFVVSIILLAFNPGINISNIMIYTTVVLMVIAMVHYAKGLYNLAQ
ncbi:CDP-alcohol phosphatidyltransferase family protein [Faecalibacillus faecis]|uniref:CDP-alcohol phosphatidyltransferase family protein n=1 Tax=Faecalibacillus faecis TaxID=1982628 RepID=UPI002EB414DF|nr:CDP-alcohol phosphatidyltransferase family protein [Bacilli bacterium]